MVMFHSLIIHVKLPSKRCHKGSSYLPYCSPVIDLSRVRLVRLAICLVTHQLLTWSRVRLVWLAICLVTHQLLTWSRVRLVWLAICLFSSSVGYGCCKDRKVTPSGLFTCKLNKFTCHLRGVWSILSLSYLHKLSSCGSIWSRATLFVNVLFR